MRRWLYITALALVTLACTSCNALNVPQTLGYSFEQGTEGWTTSEVADNLWVKEVRREDRRYVVLLITTLF